MFDFKINCCRLINDIVVGLNKPSYPEKCYGQEAVGSLVDFAKRFTAETQKSFMELESINVGFTVIKKGDVSYIIVFDDNKKVIVDIIRFNKSNSNDEDIESYYLRVKESNKKDICINIQDHKNLRDYFQNNYIRYDDEEVVIKFSKCFENYIKGAGIDHIRSIVSIWKYDENNNKIIANPDFTSLIESATLHVSSIDLNFKQNIP